MKVLIYSLYSFGTRLFETQLEIIKNLVEEGHEVHILKCNKVLRSCMWNTQHKALRCAKCQSRCLHGLKLLNIPKSHIHDMYKDERSDSFEIPHFDNMNQIKSFHYDGVDIGQGVASSLITQKRDSYLNSSSHAQEIELNLRMAINVYWNFDAIISKLQPDQVIIFNGRFAEIYPAICQVKKQNTPYVIHERGGTLDRYILYKNTWPFDIAHNTNLIQQEWEKENIITATEIGSKWFSQRRHGEVQNWKVFTKNQEKNKLPEAFDASKKNIVIFNTSEHEVGMLVGWENKFFKDQNSGIAYILKEFEQNEDFHFILRVHPHLGDLNNSQIQEINNFKHSNLTVIPPESDIDTYALMDHADLVITFGSTMGIEANFWGKPSLLLGRATYENLGSTFTPKSKEDIRPHILSHPKPLENDGAIKYGYWNATKGIKFKHYVPTEVNDGLFMNQKLGHGEMLENYLDQKEARTKSLASKVHRVINRVLGSNSNKTDQSKLDEIYVAEWEAY